MTDDRASECHQCPVYVIRCAHLGDTSVRLVDLRLGSAICDECNTTWEPPHFYIATIPKEAITEQCVSCKAQIINWWMASVTGIDGIELEAITKFQRYADQLRQVPV